MSALTRREMIVRTGKAVAAAALASTAAPLLAATGKQRFKIGACDWSIGKMGNPEAFEVAKKIGLDGVQASLGSVANDMHLRKPEVQQQYRDAAKAASLEISSLAIGEMNSIPYKSDPRPVEWVSDCVDVMSALGVKVVLLAFFGKGDLKGDNAGTYTVIERLKKVAPKAEKAGVILAIESWLNAEEHVDIIQRVGSPAVKVYYDCCNSNDMGYDIYKEIRWLGKQGLISEFHMKENGSLLGQGKVDFKKVRAAIDDIGYSGWMQIEGAVPKGAKMFESYVANATYLRGIFPKDA
jgi:L-ribulose-5-phosphate 3-epimerase